MQWKDSVFSDTIVFGLIIHSRLDSVKDLKKSIESVEGVEVVYQRKSEDHLYITRKKPEGEKGETT